MAVFHSPPLPTQDWGENSIYRSQEQKQREEFCVAYAPND